MGPGMESQRTWLSFSYGYLAQHCGLLHSSCQQKLFSCIRNLAGHPGGERWGPGLWRNHFLGHQRLGWRPAGSQLCCDRTPGRVLPDALTLVP